MQTPIQLPFQRELQELLAGQAKLEKALAKTDLLIVDVQGQLQEILRILIPPLPVGFGVTFQTQR
jgi:hypothetical protein